VKKGELVCGHCPSVEVLFNSVARLKAQGTIGVIMTGMGQDGALGLKAMRDGGARTIGQNEESCVVYGMPKVAKEKGGVEKETALEHIPATLMNILAEK